MPNVQGRRGQDVPDEDAGHLSIASLRGWEAVNTNCREILAVFHCPHWFVFVRSDLIECHNFQSSIRKFCKDADVADRVHR